MTLAKVNILYEANERLAGSDGTISIKIARDGGKNAQEYKGPYDADGIVTYVKRQYGPPSVEINTLDDAQNFINRNKIAIVSTLFSSDFVPTWSSSWNPRFALLAGRHIPSIFWRGI